MLCFEAISIFRDAMDEPPRHLLRAPAASVVNLTALS